MGIMYYLRNEHKEKFKLLWRFVVLTIVFSIIIGIGGALSTTGNILLGIIGILMTLAGYVLLILFELQIVFNQLISKYFNGKKITATQTKYKVIAMVALVLLITTVIFIPIFISSFIIILTRSMVLTFIFAILYICLCILLGTLSVLFYYAVFDTLGEGNLGFAVTFNKFAEIRKKYFKSTLKCVLISTLTSVLALIAYILILFIGTIIFALLDAAIILVIFYVCLVIAFLPIFVIVSLACTQYITNNYFGSKPTVAPENL